MGVETVESSYAWQLKLVDWQLFLHLSFRAFLPSIEGRLADCKRLVRRIARAHELQCWQLAVVIRFENGDITGRPHCHAVLKGIPGEGANMSSRFAMIHWWKEIAGIAIINGYDRALPGVNYITEGLGYVDPATAYEVSKFGKADAIYISPMARMEFMRARAFDFRPGYHQGRVVC